MAQSTVKAFKVFGVAASDSRSGPLASGTSVVQFRGLSAIVEPAEYARSEATPDEMSRYVRVIEEVYAYTPVLPAPPGTIFRSRDNLTRWLELHYFTLVEALGQVEGHSAARLTLSVTEPPVNDDAARKIQSMASDAIRDFRAHAAATVAHPHVPGESGVIATASFLVEAERWEGFAAAVTEGAKRHREFEFRLTGPWPPYDFVQMQFGG